MKVVISAGIRTQNIVDGINKKFSSGGVDFIVVPFIENIEEIYQRGEYFDKAILTEQCWNHDFEDEDIVSIRNRVNNFATASSLRGTNNISFVFLTQDLDTASKVYEEILPIHINSAVLIKEPKYSVTFFNSLVTTEVTKFPTDIVYKPVFEKEVKEEPTEEDTSKYPQYSTDYDGLTFGFEEEEEFNANRLQRKDEIEFSGFENITNETSDFDEDFDTDLTTEVADTNDTETASIDDEEQETELYNTIGELPDDFNTDFGTDIEFDKAVTENRNTINLDKENFVAEETWASDDNNTEEEFNDFKVGEIPDYSGPLGNGLVGDEHNSEFNEYDSEPEYTEPEYTEPEYVEPEYAEPEYIEPEYQDQYQGEYNPDFDNLNNGAHFSNGFDDKDYADEPSVEAPVQHQYKRVDMSNDQIKATLDAFANRGNSILLTGCGGCGTSTMALNLANIINNLGYTVLLVDLDTENKAQSYMSKESYDCVEPDSAGLMAAINSTSGINAHVSIVRQGFHLLTMGMASDSAPIEKVIQKEKISRFINLAKTSHNFVIYDVPFKTAMGFGKDFTFMADNVVVILDCSNWGISKTMLNMCNTEDDDMQETLFNRGQLLFNRYRIMNKVMGNKVKTAIDITKVMDAKVRDLLGEDPGYYFQSMHISGIINESKAFEAGWFESTQYSDTPEGSKVFIEVLKNIVLKR